MRFVLSYLLVGFPINPTTTSSRPSLSRPSPWSPPPYRSIDDVVAPTNMWSYSVVLCAITVARSTSTLSFPFIGRLCQCPRLRHRLNRTTVAMPVAKKTMSAGTTTLLELRLEGQRATVMVKKTME